MSAAARLALVAATVLLAGCTCCVQPATGPARTLTADCVGAWATVAASPSGSSAIDAPMRACPSLEDFVMGAQAAHVFSDQAVTKLVAQQLCGTGRFSETAICVQLGITPPPATPGQT